MARLRFVLAAVLCLSASVSQATAQGIESLAKQSQNPIANLISLPFQNNANFNVGRLDNDQNILNIQPIIPFKLTYDWSLVTRWILPIVYQPALFQGDDTNLGLGDFNPTFFLNANLSPNLMAGIGPTFLLPTRTDHRLGPDKWGTGPSAAIAWTPGKWVIGAIANNIWSFAGSSKDRVNQFLLQYFVNYNMGNGWFLVSAPIITTDWTRDSGDQWTTPLGGGVGRVFNIGPQPMSMSLQAYYNVIRPEGGPNWQLRFQVQLLFPQQGNNKGNKARRSPRNRWKPKLSPRTPNRACR